MKTLFYKLLLILLLINSYFIYCQTTNSFFERITTKEGLSQSTVNYIMQDKSGFMWFATYGGISRYDGYNFKVYRNIPKDINSLSDNGSSYLYLDKEGWI
jgi:ligand-binding sensor domain-containing protein